MSRILTLVLLSTAVVTVSARASEKQCRQLFTSQSTFETYRERPFQEFANVSLHSNSFQIGRQLKDYDYMLSTPEISFQDRIEKLSESSIWIDMGAGHGTALLQGLNLNSRIGQAVAIAVNRPEAPPGLHADPQRFNYLKGFVERLWETGALASYTGRVDVITDVVGVVSYSKDIATPLSIYLKLLKPGGTLHFTMMIERGSAGTPMQPVNEFYVDGEKRPDGLMSWLRSIKGIEILDGRKIAAESNGYAEHSINLVLRRTNEPLQMADIQNLQYIDGTPPARVFSLRTSDRSARTSAALTRIDKLQLLEEVDGFRRGNDPSRIRIALQKLGYSDTKHRMLSRLVSALSESRMKNLNTREVIDRIEGNFSYDVYTSPLDGL